MNLSEIKSYREFLASLAVRVGSPPTSRKRSPCPGGSGPRDYAEDFSSKSSAKGRCLLGLRPFFQRSGKGFSHGGLDQTSKLPGTARIARSLGADRIHGADLQTEGFSRPDSLFTIWKKLLHSDRSSAIPSGIYWFASDGRLRPDCWYGCRSCVDSPWPKDLGSFFRPACWHVCSMEHQFPATMDAAFQGCKLWGLALPIGG